MPNRRVWVSILVLGVTATARGQSERVSFSRNGWDLAKDQARVDTLLGREQLILRGGRAVFRPTSLQDGTIEFDMQVSAYRSFVYFNFRMQADNEYEELYFRPQKSGLPDAVQYSPVFNGVSSWQLYHGPGGTAAARLESDHWIHVRVVLQGQRAAVYVGDTKEPQLTIPLVRTPAPGYIAFSCFPNDPDAPPGTACARFSDLVVHSGTVVETLSQLPPRESLPPGTIAEWNVSPVFAPDSGNIEQLPTSILQNPAWRLLKADDRGILHLTRHQPRQQGVRRPAVLAQTSITSTRVVTARLDLGYSDDVSVFLNGRLIFAASDSYRFDLPRREGLIGFDQAALYLPLQKGRNVLTLAVSDVFGGWGLMAKLPTDLGLTVAPN